MLSFHGLILIQNTSELKIQVEWAGLPDVEDYTWEPRQQEHGDVTGLLEDYLHSSGDHDLKLKPLNLFNV